MANQHMQAAATLSTARIFRTWWPLAAGWLLMTLEIPAISAAVARRPEPEINLAAWGLVFSLSLILGSPAIMMLGTSTTLSRDWDSYRRVSRYSLMLSIALTAVHALLAFTPLFDLVVVRIIAVPPEIVEPARTGMRIMLPYVLALAYRRLNYGVLIRFGDARAVTTGAGLRLAADLVAMVLLFTLTAVSGIVMAALTFVTGILVEAVYAGLRVRPVLRGPLLTAPPAAEPLTLPVFTRFYLPLVMTSLLQILVQPVGAAALSRMPNPLQSLAVWPVVYGLLMLFNSGGMAYTEAVVVLLDEPRSVKPLHRFTLYAGLTMVALLAVMVVSPMVEVWFRQVAALPDTLVSLARVGVLILLPLPGLTFLQSWHTGMLMMSRRTRAVTESVVLALATNVAVLSLGMAWGSLPGLYVGLAGLAAGNYVRTAWLWYRTRRTKAVLLAREHAINPDWVGVT